MDHVTALALVNDELAKYGKSPLKLSEPQSQQAFASLRRYAENTGRPIDVAAADIVRFQIQSQSLQRSN